MAKRGLTKTQKLRKTVQQQVRRMESRGYRINTELKEKIKTAKYATLKSIQNNRYAKLYEASSAEIDTNIVTGRQFRQYERKKAAEKAVETRRINEEKRRVEQQAREAYERGYREETERIADDVSGYDETEWTDDDERSYQEAKERRSQEYSDEQEEWEEQRAQQDEADLSFANAIEQGRVMYENITDLIERFPRAGADILQKALASEINKYGLDLVMAGMAQSPINVVEEAQKIVHYNGTKENIHRSITSLFDSITGTIRTMQESMTIGEVMDQMTDMSEP